MPITPWKSKSFRYWIAIGMTVALAPLASAVIGGIFIFNHGVIGTFHDIAVRHVEKIDPTQHLVSHIWDVITPVVEYVGDGDEAHLSQYRQVSAHIDSEFKSLQNRLADEPDAYAHAERALTDWNFAQHIANELITTGTTGYAPQTVEQVKRFRSKIVDASQKLGAVYEDLDHGIVADYKSALLAYERSLWLTGIAAAISLFSVIFGVFAINRIIASSVNRIIDGAARLGEGDHDHRIEVQVPPELKRVADEFNRMGERIEQSESALADLARRDALTDLLNRRSFDESLAEMHARLQREDIGGALISLDIDHFKRINDTYGHPAGDEVIRELARRLTADVRAFDRVFRTGGEEFSVLVPGASMHTACEMAERMRADVAESPVRVDGTDIAFTISLGVAKASAALRPEQLIEAADAALYHAKNHGRNRVSVIDEFGVHDAAPACLQGGGEDLAEPARRSS